MPPRFEHEHDDEHEHDLVAAPLLCDLLGKNFPTIGWKGSAQKGAKITKTRCSFACLTGRMVMHNLVARE
jgi:hypothetical protein